MTSDLSKLMETISLLQSVNNSSPVIEVTESVSVHPIIQAMRELKEDGIIESVDAHTIYSTVQSGHREPDDFIEGDIGDRIYWFDDYKLSSLPIASLNLDEYYVDEDLVNDYIEHIKYSPKTMPPIVYDPIAKSIIDGIHRANAYDKLGYESIPAYVGLTKSNSYGEREPNNIDETVGEPVIEASPDTLEGSFTPDLVESKTWLCEKLAKGLKGKNAGTIYALGSWYGNIGVFLEQAGVQFNKLVLVEPDEDALMRSKKLLQPLNDKGKLVLIHQNAEDVVYEMPGVVINTSCNETGPLFLTKLPDNMLCLLQARNSVNELTDTNSLEEFIELFPVSETYYSGEKQLSDPDTAYDRFMIIGRAKSSLSEARMSPKAYRKAISAGADKGVMVGYEFEICIPNANFQKDIDDLMLIQAVFKNEAVFGMITVLETDNIGDREVSPESLDYLMTPVGNSAKPNYASFTKVNDKFNLIGYTSSALVKKMFPEVTTNYIEKNITDFFEFPEPKTMLQFLEKIFRRKFNESYLKELDTYAYEAAGKYLKPLVETTMGADVVVFNAYHQKKKNMTSWYIEPDTSLVAKNNDVALEVVSPPLPARQAITDLKKFYTLSRQEDFYTGQQYGTGLHINVSIPEDTDALKLAVFLGDQYVLKQFDRTDNSYAVSVMQSLKDYGISPYNTTDGNTAFNWKILQNTIKSITDDHYASISIENSKYVSFRHTGGDYLNEEESILNTVGRFVKAMIIASDPEMYKNEYLAKLSKLFKAPAKRATPLESLRKTINSMKQNGVPILKVGIISVAPLNEALLTTMLEKLHWSWYMFDITKVEENANAYDMVLSRRNPPPAKIFKASRDEVYSYYAEFLPKVDSQSLGEVQYNNKNPVYRDRIVVNPHDQTWAMRTIIEFMPYSDPDVRAYADAFAKKYYNEIKGSRQGVNETSIGQEHQTGGSLGLPFPGTYEQEYNMFKSKGPRRITAMTNEALDSSYEYFRSRNPLDKEFKFVTEDGISYSVIFSGKDLVEVAFSAILPGEENNFRPNKITLTGTGNSRKVFGTVIKIVQEYVATHEPNGLYFTAGEEPSRLRLYDTMISQVDKALPNYYATKAIELGDGKAYMLKRKEAKLDEALDSSYEYDKGTLNNIYYFATENNILYKVIFQGKDIVELVFYPELEDDEGDTKPTTELTGTGNSRKVLGTVIEIVQDYTDTYKPKALYFTADSSEPSRVKLYNAMIAQADKVLPDYYAIKPTKLGSDVAYMLKKKEK